MESVGFCYRKNNYYFEIEDLVVVINAQKSNYSNSYYINCGFCVKELHEDMKNPKISDCDIMGRFVNNIGSTETHIFNLDDIHSEEELIKSIENNFINKVVPVLNKGISQYFELYSQAIYTAKKF